VDLVLRNPVDKDTVRAPVSHRAATDELPMPIAPRDLTASSELAILIGGHRRVTVVPREPTHPGKFPAEIGYPAPESEPVAIVGTNGDASVELVNCNDAMATLVDGIVATRPGAPPRNAPTCGRGGRRGSS
jgi:hypothetical protein